MNKDLAISSTALTTAVGKKIDALVKGKEINLPKKYSPGNALKAASLVLQQTKDKDKRPVLETCDPISVSNCLFDMVIQGLNPAKKQCYFIAYGKTLTLMRSYHGSKAMALSRGYDMIAEIIYKGDEIELEIASFGRNIKVHSTKFENIGGPIVGAYCKIVDSEGKTIHCEIMTKAQIETCWKKAKGQNVHKEYPDQMAKRTVTNRAAKMINYVSDDSNLEFQNALDNSGEPETNQTLEKETQAEQNTGEVIDIQADSVSNSEAAPIVEEDNSKAPRRVAPRLSSSVKADF